MFCPLDTRSNGCPLRCVKQPDARLAKGAACLAQKVRERLLRNSAGPAAAANPGPSFSCRFAVQTEDDPRGFKAVSRALLTVVCYRGGRQKRASICQ
jgi:hypothetical protein